MDPDALDPFEDASLEDRSRPALRKGLVIGCAIAAAISAALALIGFIGLIALGLLMDEGRIPNSAAVPGRELTATTLDFLHSEGLLGEDERVLFFYGDGFLSVRADGNFFTDRRAVSYWEDDDEIRFEAAGYHEIEGVVFEPDDSLFANSVITIERVDGSQFGLVVSNEENKDEEFFELLDRTWKENR